MRILLKSPPGPGPIQAQPAVAGNSSPLSIHYLSRGQVGFHAAYDGQTHQVTSIGNALARLIKPTKAICTSSQAY
jgi:hypothetical protein